MDRQSCVCGHGWFYHHEFDDELDRYVAFGCDHWSGCKCREYRPEEEKK